MNKKDDPVKQAMDKERLEALIEAVDEGLLDASECEYIDPWGDNEIY